MKDYFPIFQMYQALRHQLLEILTDEDLSYRVEGKNPALGALCREIGEIEYAYIQSFKTFRQDFSYRNEEPGLETSLSRLSAWYKKLDDELKAAVEALSDEDIQNKKIDRGAILPCPHRSNWMFTRKPC